MSFCRTILGSFVVYSLVFQNILLVMLGMSHVVSGRALAGLGVEPPPGSGQLLRALAGPGGMFSQLGDGLPGTRGKPFLQGGRGLPPQSGGGTLPRSLKLAF